MELSRIGPYRIVRKLGEGGMGVVYEATHEQIQRRAAIKVLRPGLSQDPQTATRFFNEARAVNIIRHPGIVSVSDLGQTEDGLAYIVMEFLEGETLRLRLQRKAPGGAGLRIVRQVAAALASAHEKGIVHRDLKPDNVMLVPDSDVMGGERAKVLDFGIAKLAAEHHQPGQSQHKTDTGVTLGTAAYMSPEQCRGDRSVDDRTDVYALGCILYQMYAGRPPFQADGWGALVAMHIYEQPTPIQEAAPSISAELAELVQRMLAKQPAQRPSMRQVMAAIDQIAPGAPLEAGGNGGGGAANVLPALPSPEDADMSTTMGQSAGEPVPVPRGRTQRRRQLTLFGGLAILGIVGAGVSWLRLRAAPPPATSPARPPASQVVSPPPAATPDSARPGSAPAPVNPAYDPEKRKPLPITRAASGTTKKGNAASLKKRGANRSAQHRPPPPDESPAHAAKSPPPDPAKAPSHSAHPATPEQRPARKKAVDVEFLP